MSYQLNRKSLISQLLPTIDIATTSNEIRIKSQRFDTPRFIALETEGFCRKCPPDVDYLVAKDGIYVLCDRLKGGEKFVPFDHIYELPEYCAFRVRHRKLFRFVHVFPPRRQTLCVKHSRKRPVKEQQKQQDNDLPLLTGILPHLIPRDDSSEQQPIDNEPIPENFKKEPPTDQPVPILTTVLPHLFSHSIQQEEMQTVIPEETSTPQKEDSIPLLTGVLPHLIGGEEEWNNNNNNEKKMKPEEDETDNQIPILTTLLPHIGSQL